MDKTLTIQNCDWQITLNGVDDEVTENLVAQRAKGQNFHATMVMDNITMNGEVKNFRQLLIIEHDQGNDKVGDVVIQFRLNPKTNRYNVQVEEENVFETETNIKKIWRALRSSVDNIAQAVKKTVAHSGWIYANARRIGGKPIKTHYVIVGWSPQLVDQMMDVYDYVQSLDSPGLATFLKALQIMPEKPARDIFNQMRKPSDR
ncbi:MAG: hypothetical protein WDA13_04065 [Candidatus Shapirobacteria bacterium]